MAQSQSCLLAPILTMEDYAWTNPSLSPLAAITSLLDLQGMFSTLSPGWEKFQSLLEFAEVNSMAKSSAMCFKHSWWRLHFQEPGQSAMTLS